MTCPSSTKHGKGESMASEWFYRSGSDEFGPVSSTEVRSLVKAGKIVPTTPIRKTDGAKWTKAERIKGLFDGIQPQPEEEVDPLIALASQATSSVASATKSAASSIGNAVSGWKDRRKERQAEAASATPDSDPSESDKFTLDDQPADVVMKVVEKVSLRLILRHRWSASIRRCMAKPCSPEIPMWSARPRRLPASICNLARHVSVLSRTLAVALSSTGSFSNRVSIH